MNHDQLKERLYNRTVLSDDESCWLWLGAESSNGYGAIGVDGSIHRVSYMIHVGPIPTGMFVCHTCDTKLCINPNHLFIGSHQDNMDDMNRKGRGLKGEQASNAKLTEAQVREAHKRRSTGEKVRDIASSYGVSHSTISLILSGTNWLHVYQDIHKEN